MKKNKFTFEFNFAEIVNGSEEVTFTVHTTKKSKKFVLRNKQLILEELVKHPIWSNDITGKLWSFDFELKGLWIENISFSNDLKCIECFVC